MEGSSFSGGGNGFIPPGLQPPGSVCNWTRGDPVTSCCEDLGFKGAERLVLLANFLGDLAKDLASAGECCFPLVEMRMAAPPGEKTSPFRELVGFHSHTTACCIPYRCERM